MAVIEKHPVGGISVVIENVHNLRVLGLLRGCADNVGHTQTVRLTSVMAQGFERQTVGDGGHFQRIFIVKTDTAACFIKRASDGYCIRCYVLVSGDLIQPIQANSSGPSGTQAKRTIAGTKIARVPIQRGHRQICVRCQRPITQIVFCNVDHVCATGVGPMSHMHIE